MRTRSRIWRAAAVLALAALPCGAQVRYKIPDPVIERTWEVAEDGKWRWPELDAKCPDCKGRKTEPCRHCTDRELPVCAECDGDGAATCRTCAGRGKVIDPLVELVCPYCWGSAWYVCGMCRGGGQYGVEGAERKQECGGCDGRGSLPCVACKGERVIPAVKVGRKGPGEAKAKDLHKVRETLQETLELVEAYEPVENASKSNKNFAKAVKPAARVLGVIGDMQELLDESLKALRGGAGYVGYKDWVTNQFIVFKDRTTYLLKHQLLLVDLCLEFADHNEQ